MSDDQLKMAQALKVAAQKAGMIDLDWLKIVDTSKLPRQTASRRRSFDH